MKTIFTELVNKRKLEEKRKQSRIIVDFLNFMNINGLRFHTEVDLGDDGKQVLQLDPSPEQIDVWLINFFDVYDKVKNK